MGKGRFPKGLKICCGVSALLIISLLVVSTVLFLTILKPKQPKIITQPATLEHIKLVPIPFHLNVSLGIVATVDNRNYGSFKYGNSTTFVSYRGTVAGDAPIESDTIPARRKHNISTTVVIVAEKLTSNPSFGADFFNGCLNFTSSTTVHGKASVLKFLKMKATSYCTCNISVFFRTQNATSVCISKVKY